MAVKAAKAKKVVTKAKSPAERKSRRTAYQLLQDFQDKRDKVVFQYEAKLSSLDSKIAKLQERHASRIAVAQVLDSMTADEILAAEKRVRLQLQAIRKAARMSSKAQATA